MAKTQTFESAFARLEIISKELESGETSLDQSVALYEEGMQLIRFCEEKLTAAEKKIVILSKTDDGSFEEKLLDDAD